MDEIERLRKELEEEIEKEADRRENWYETEDGWFFHLDPDSGKYYKRKLGTRETEITKEEILELFE